MANPVPRPQVVVAIFSERDDAERAIHELQDAGFPRTGIGVALRDRDAGGALIRHTDSEVAEGAATGAIGGGMLGGLVGLLVGVGALVIPGVGPVIAGGALASVLGVAGGTAAAGAGIGAAGGGILGALVGLGVPAEEAERLERGLHEGGTLLTVDAAGRDAEVRDILERCQGDLAVVESTEYAGAAAATDATPWAGPERRSSVRHGRRRSDYQSGGAS